MRGTQHRFDKPIQVVFLLDDLSVENRPTGLDRKKYDQDILKNGPCERLEKGMSIRERGTNGLRSQTDSSFVQQQDNNIAPFKVWISRVVPKPTIDILRSLPSFA